MHKNNKKKFNQKEEIISKRSLFEILNEQGILYEDEKINEKEDE
ncbi:hypothetical protein [[Mycoplasma] collis]|nr:hypothetical protein [[Mycoplasma] collis]